MNPFLVGYIGMLGIFMTHAIARAAYDCGKGQQYEMPFIPQFHHNSSGMVEAEKRMEIYVAERQIPMDMLMMTSSEDMRNEMLDDLTRDLEYTIFEGIREFIKIEEYRYDGRGDPPFPCKTFRASIRVAKDEY